MNFIRWLLDKLRTAKIGRWDGPTQDSGLRTQDSGLTTQDSRRRRVFLGVKITFPW